MDQVVPWHALLALIEPVYPKAGSGRRPYTLKTMLRIHLMQNWFTAIRRREAQHDVAPLHPLRLSLARASVPDETTILNFRRLLEQYDLWPKLFAAVNAHLTDKDLLLRHGTIVDATIIHARLRRRSPHAVWRPFLRCVNGRPSHAHIAHEHRRNHTADTITNVASITSSLPAI